MCSVLQMYTTCECTYTYSVYVWGTSHYTCTCTCPPAQLMRPGIVSCALGDCLTSRPKGRSRPRESWFLIYSCTCTCISGKPQAYSCSESEYMYMYMYMKMHIQYMYVQLLRQGKARQLCTCTYSPTQTCLRGHCRDSSAPPPHACRISLSSRHPARSRMHH